MVNRALKSADFSGNSIGDEGTAALSDALKTNSTLETLELRSNRVGAAGAQSLAGMLQVNRALTSVNLLNNDLGDGAAAIVAAAKQNGNIKTLCGINEGKTKVSFFHHCLKAPDAVLLSFDLEFNRALTSLDLSTNRIFMSRGGGWTHDPNAAWEYVHTDGRKTDDRPAGVDFEDDLSGIQALADALKVNRALNFVDLRANSIPHEGKQQLRDAVKGKNITLQL